MPADVETCEWGGRVWRRYPNSPRRSHRVYFQCHAEWKRPPLYLHREVWKAAHGPIPDGCDIHHADGNPLNNDVANLECLTVGEHRRRHREAYRSERQLEHLRRIRPRGLAGLARWKQSPEGVAALRENGRAVMASRPFLDFACPQCGCRFRSRQARAVYCSSACRQRSNPARPSHPGVCGWCGGGFLSCKRGQRFCGRACASRARESGKRAGV
jgi:hypothetical protein